jgi:carbon-monoxide dehydrogenase large subunit
MPFDNVTDKHFDSGDYPETSAQGRRGDRLPAVRARQKRGEPDGRLIGLGISIFSEQTAHGTTADGKRRALYEQVFARHHPGRTARSRAGIQSIGQGLETTLAQIASECLGVDPPTFTSSSATPSFALFERRLGLARHRLGRRRDRARLQGTRVARGRDRRGDAADRRQIGPGARRRRVRPARQRLAEPTSRAAFYLAPSDLPGDIDPHGLEVTGGYAPSRLTGVHTGSAHATVVAVDPETGGVEILDYVVVEDAGRPDQPDDRRRPDSRRHRAGHRRGAVRGKCRSTRKASR